MPNVSSTDLLELGLNNLNIKRVYTILHEDQLYKQTNIESGNITEVDLDEAILNHGHNVFLEDKLHDWFIRDGKFHIYSRISEKNSHIDLLIEYTSAEEL